ncbi:MAG: flavodoxin-dependent (E)-4-hydroxy-3-methylbut-2-enyl-diphosphate synthase [Candidatus Micrarchaeia archaeon]|jgi:(E)-4-hydroxy-3-methylbut-2-enyl-diphosphate synthase
MIQRKLTRVVDLNGKVKIGGDNPILIQSMTNTSTADAEATIKQTQALFGAGGEAVRITVNDEEAVKALPEIRAAFPNKPLVADIHYDYTKALAAIEAGFDKVRINPGNIGDKEKVKAVIEAAKKANVAIRIGVNGGSLDKDIEEKYGRTAQASVESAMQYVKMMEELDFHNFVLSIKWSDIPRMIEANRLLSKRTDYPLHLGLTEAGTVFSGSVLSAAALSPLLLDGIGDTVRVSLTGDPVRELRTAKIIFQGLGLKIFGPNLTSCPTCGRTEIDLNSMAEQVEERLMREYSDYIMHVAVMGCIVNGIGEGKEADIGIAGGKGRGVIFKKGVQIGTYPEAELIDKLFELIGYMVQNGEVKNIKKDE